MKRAVLAALRELCRRRWPVALVTHLSSGAQALVTAEDDPGRPGELALSDAVIAQVRAMLDGEVSGIVADDLFVRVWGPPWTLVLVGAVHIAQVLAPMAQLAGFAATVIDPRRGFAIPERFPGIRLLVDWPDEAMAAEPPGRRTAVVTLAHDPKIDDPALCLALRSPAFHVGALGSRRTHAVRRERLAEAGYSAEELDRIAAPVGLDIGSHLPGEIAVSILAEVVAVRHGRPRVRR
jgi:xanthine dehydrogenase accessory factor